MIARNSTFAYKGKPVKINQIAEELGVQYVLEGSVRKSENRVRITAQLTDALSGRHLWAERYDRDLKDIFDLQDEITKNILTALQVKLTRGESARLVSKGTKNLQAYLKYWQAVEKLLTQSKEGNLSARSLLKEVIALDPKFPSAYVMLGFTHSNDIFHGVSKSSEKSFVKAMDMAKKAVAMDDSLPGAHRLLGWLYMLSKNYGKAIAECELAVTLEPSSAASVQMMSMAHRYAGNHKAALEFAEKAIRLNPIRPASYFFRNLGICYMFNGRYEDAINNFKKALNLSPNDVAAYVNLAVAYIKAGKEDKARETVGNIIQLNPKTSLLDMKRLVNYRNQADNDMYIDALRRAGMPEHPPLPLPDKPSVAVLPFVNMSGDSEQEYFSDGITEDIITSLSKVSDLFVIARTSSFKYKGKMVDVRDVGRDLGVRCILEGSIRKVGDRIRITAQLVDATTGHHLWAERYDRQLKDIFALQDEITRRVLAGTRVSLTEGEQARLRYNAKSSPDIRAYEKILQARSQYFRMNPEGNAMARIRAEEAIEIDPDYAAPYVYLAFTHLSDIMWGTSSSPGNSLQLAENFARRALSLDDSLPMAIIALAQVHLYKRQHEKAIAEGQKALALDPNGAEVYNHLGFYLHMAGRPAEAIPLLEKAIRLNPYPPSFYYTRLGAAYIAAGRVEEAIAECRKAIKRQPDDVFALITLAIIYKLQGREEVSRSFTQKVLRIMPDFSAERFSKGIPFKDQSRTDSFVALLRNAGLN